MGFPTTFEELMSQLSQEFSSTTGWYELAVLSIAVLSGWLAYRRWKVVVMDHLGESEKSGFARVTLRSTERISFPLVMLIIVLLGRLILTHLKHSTLLLDLCVPLLTSFAGIRVTLYILRRSFAPSKALKAWEGVVSITIWIVVGLYLVGWLPAVIVFLAIPLFAIGDNPVSILSILKFLFSIIIFIVVAGWLSRVIERNVQKSDYINPSMQVGLVKFSKFFLYTLAILIAISVTGINLAALTVFGGALGVGLGFGLQRIASNFISGFILLFDRSIKPGDVISVGTRFGWVQELRARYIVVRDREGVETLIPNENLITTEVTNWSYSDRKVRVKIPVQISYNDDPEVARDLMVQACQGVERILTDPSPQVRLTDFADNGINLQLRIWIQDPQNGLGAVKSVINFSIWKLFKENNITIPFPQRDVHLIDSQSKPREVLDTSKS
ncbi:Potassium efflux system KefA protein / Small-conductance mechanosensitive channel [hydrothermal vent metagenome]|uniref:Potassium efflux system KefA protein / Small-conductance mechanosensitive channel n=1 Tax=hydrothermal vent metagenome TaxID=652676 RepID=A0A3B0Y5Q4_9ZZZZ